jgi:uncharacterized protein YwqG
MDLELLQQYDLARLAPVLTKMEKQAIGFGLAKPSDETTSRSRLGGNLLLPREFEWPYSQQGPLDFLLQIDLAEIKQFDPTGALPSSGLLTFFYDLENQPWGFDPSALDGFYVELIADESLVRFEAPGNEYSLDEHVLSFSQAPSLPRYGSRDYDELERLTNLTDEDEYDRYYDFVDEYEAKFYPTRARHRLFGYSSNVQGDMQLEAQLVTNGLYCGDASGYEDPKAEALSAGASDWILLLQLDSDPDADLMWGDAGLLYYWIRAEDLAARRFDRVWMTLQCH